MKRLLGAALGAVMAIFAAAAPARADVPFAVTMVAGAPIGLVWHSMVVNRCHNRQLTADEAKRTLVFPFYSVFRAYVDCRKK